MKLLTQIYIICSFLFIFRYILNYTSKKQEIKKIEMFIKIKEYIKLSLYHIVTKLQETKKDQVQTNSQQIQTIDKSINRIAMTLSMKLFTFVRKQEIEEEIEKCMEDHDIKIFLFPDTLLTNSGLQYYNELIRMSRLLYPFSTLENGENLSESDSKIFLEAL